MHWYMDKNFEKLLLVPKADCRKVCIKFILCIIPCLNFTKKDSYLTWANMNCGYYMNSVQLNQSKRQSHWGLSCRLQKCLSPWIEDWTETLIKLWQSWGTLMIQGIRKRKLWHNCYYYIVRENWLTHQQQLFLGTGQRSSDKPQNLNNVITFLTESR